MGAWQQADPAVDQVPYTFPPVLAINASKAQPKAKSKAKKSKAPVLRKAGQAAQTQARQMHIDGHQPLPGPVRMNNATAEQLTTTVQARGVGVSPAEYAQALYEDL